MPISNERPSPFARKAQVRRPPMHHSPPAAPKPHVDENTLKTCTFEIERKIFYLFLKENHQGRFLRITESASGRSNSIIIPESGLEAFVKAFADVVSGVGESQDEAGNREGQ